MRVLGDWLLTPQRAAVHLPTATAVIADLHLGYDGVRRRGGEAVPTGSLSSALDPLRDLFTQQSIARLVIAGDLFEDGRGHGELAEAFAGWLTDRAVQLLALVPGNHDRGLPAGSLPVCPDGVRLGEWLVIHGDRPHPGGPVVQGHEHPWFRWRSGVEGPCFLVGPDHLILPAYSTDAAGTNVLRQERWPAYHCVAIAGERVLDFGELANLRRRR